MAALKAKKEKEAAELKAKREKEAAQLKAKKEKENIIIISSTHAESESINKKSSGAES